MRVYLTLLFCSFPVFSISQRKMRRCTGGEVRFHRKWWIELYSKLWLKTIPLLVLDTIVRLVTTTSPVIFIIFCYQSSSCIISSCIIFYFMIIQYANDVVQYLSYGLSLGFGNVLFFYLITGTGFWRDYVHIKLNVR